MSETLKLCPWCKKEPVRMVGRDGWVCCPKCGVAKPIEVWNLRTPDWRALAQEAGKALRAMRDYHVCEDCHYDGPPLCS